MQKRRPRQFLLSPSPFSCIRDVTSAQVFDPGVFSRRHPLCTLNREEKFNVGIFRSLGELGLLGVTVPPEYGGSGMDATAACIVHEELSAADPACCLSYLGLLSIPWMICA